MKCVLNISCYFLAGIASTSLFIFLFFYPIKFNITKDSILDPIEKGLNSSVTVVAGEDTGSGVVFINSGHTFVWTNAHVVRTAMKMNYHIDFDTDQITKETNFSKIIVQKEIVSGGQKTGFHSYYAEVIRFNYDEDLALLKLHCERSCHNLTSVTFIDLEYMLAPDVEVFHVGSPGGVCGEGFISKGNVAAIGRVFDDKRNDLAFDAKMFDLVSIGFFDGSSGGGIFQRSNGMCVGLVSQKLTPGNINAALIIPSRRIRSFAIGQDCEWAVDHNISVCQDQIKPRVTGRVYLTPKDLKTSVEKR